MNRKRAVFLDRDGTINQEVDHLWDIKRLRILPGAAKAIKHFNKLGFVVIVISNQSVIGHGLCDENDLAKINTEIARRVGREGAVIDAFYHCPHHPKAKLKKYRLQCRCRKPETGLIKKAAKQLRIDIKASFLIGDSTRDMLAGKRAHLTTILVKTGYGGQDGLYKADPNFFAKNLLEAARLIGTRTR